MYQFFPFFVWHYIHKHWKHMCFSGLGLILVIHCLFISAIGFRELFALQIGKKSPYERQMTNEYLLCGLPYRAGAISCVWYIASVPQCSRCITQGGLRGFPCRICLIPNIYQHQKTKTWQKNTWFKVCDMLFNSTEPTVNSFNVKLCKKREKILYFNPLNTEFNPICYLLALLGAHHFLHVGRMRVKLLTLRRLMSYIYIWSTHSWCF